VRLSAFIPEVSISISLGVLGYKLGTDTDGYVFMATDVRLKLAFITGLLRFLSVRGCPHC
jgi:hypothetical protein